LQVKVQTHTAANVATGKELTFNQEGRHIPNIGGDGSLLVLCSGYTVMLVWSVWTDAMRKAEANRHAFIMPDMWPPNSHDLKLVNYIWVIITLIRLPDKSVECEGFEAASDWCVARTEHY